MRLIQAIYVAMLLLLGPAGPAPAQEPSPVSSQSPAAPAADDKQRSAKETKQQLERLACGPSHVHLAHHTEKGSQTLPEQPPDKGLIYVIRTRKNLVGSVEQANFAMDRKWVGVNGIGNYFYLNADPGPHYFCLKYRGGPPALLSLVIEKGETYYLLQNDVIGGISIDLLDEKEGQHYLAKYRRSIFEEKPHK